MRNSDLSKKAKFLLTLLTLEIMECVILNVSIYLKMHCMVFPKIQQKKAIGNKAAF